MHETQETRVRSLEQEDPLEKKMAIHSRILAWKILWSEEHGRLCSMGLQSRTRLSGWAHRWFSEAHYRRKKKWYHKSLLFLSPVLQRQLFWNHEVAKVDKVKNGQQGPRKTEQEDRSSVGPYWHCWTTVPNCSCSPWGLFHEIKRCLYNEVTFIQLFCNLQPQTFQLYFPGKF